MKLFSIETGNFRLDGGAMFGVVPKVLWNKQYPADDNNLCNWAMRSLLVVNGNRKILIDNGIGDTLDKKYLDHFYLNGDLSLESSLSKVGFSPEEITDVILTHLHFDHCGGNIKRKENGDGFEPTFPNAMYWMGMEQYNNALNPNAREKASYFKHMILPVKDSGQLILVNREGEIMPGISIKFFNGHTIGQMIPYINYNGKTLVYMGDLMPAAAHIPLSWIIAYDMRPEQTLEEKEAFLKEAVENDYILFFEHDIFNECCSVKMTEKGVRVKERFKLLEI